MSYLTSLHVEQIYFLLFKGWKWILGHADKPITLPLPANNEAPDRPDALNKICISY